VELKLTEDAAAAAATAATAAAGWWCNDDVAIRTASGRVVGDAVEAYDDVVGRDAGLWMGLLTDASALNHQAAVLPSVTQSTDVDEHRLLGSQHVPRITRLICQQVSKQLRK